VSEIVDNPPLRNGSNSPLDRDQGNDCSRRRTSAIAAPRYAQTTLRVAYERAPQKYSDDYQEVLWTAADDVMLRRCQTFMITLIC
jgi:hypothetical protein